MIPFRPSQMGIRQKINIPRMNLFLLLTFFSCAGHTQAMAIDTAAYYEEIAAYRSGAIQSLWQSERQPILPGDTIHLHFFNPNIEYRMPCKLKIIRDPKPFEMATYSGLVQKYIPYGVLEMEHQGQSFSMEVYQNYELLKSEEYSDYLFLPFKDHTNGETTYGGGRYLNLSAVEIKEKGCMVDFNKAYNPWCAYRDDFNCPIPPVANHLEFEIRAGEKIFTGFPE